MASSLSSSKNAWFAAARICSALLGPSSKRAALCDASCLWSPSIASINEARMPGDRPSTHW
eukprot:3339393-Pyramimonas_sp.AAC.1